MTLTCPRCRSTNVSVHVSPALGMKPQDDGFRCSDCGLTETRYVTDPDYEQLHPRWGWDRKAPQTTYEEIAQGIQRRQADREQRAREWTWPTELDRPSWQAVSNRERRAEKLAEYFAETEYTLTTIVDDRLSFSYHKRLPQDLGLLAEVLECPDHDAPRAAFAAWMRAQSDPRASAAADFIEAQLGLAQAVRANPSADHKAALPKDVFASPEDTPDWWRYPEGIGDGLAAALSDTLAILKEEGLIDDLRWYRGFVEHVAIKAHRFLEIADELYSLAPIRHLTITYAKGLDHRDEGLWNALLASPHLDRIRSLRFPVRVLDNEYTELNRLTDRDLELFASSSHLRGLRYLDLEDEEHLTARGFEALAASRSLPELSAVQHDIYRYEYLGAFAMGNVGPRQRELVRRPLREYAPQLEARHGRIAWLHPAENYGSDAPDLEAVVEHPVALRQGS